MARKPSGPVLVVDGNRDDRARTADLLREAGFAVCEAVNGEEALRSARSEQPSAVVLDVCLPGLSGYEVCRELKDDFGEAVPVMFVSGERTETFDRVGGLLVGADDYLVKPFAPDELLARLRALIRRASPTPVGAEEAPSAAELTRRELDVLRLLAEGLEQAEIAERLVISPKTVAGHIERILKKLDVHSRAQAVALAFRERLVSP